MSKCEKLKYIIQLRDIITNKNIIYKKIRIIGIFLKKK